ncbi:MAG TPA: hypothetical protein VIF09_17325 [Polyangiaceae bacterium]|jgi:mono/diheme cytochrome c family protein
MRSLGATVVAPLVLVLASCNGKASPPPAPGLGDVMSQVGRRFELAGRAALAGRFELADFETGELEELFENDVPRASLPKEGPTAHIPVMSKAFLETNLPALQQAAARKVPAAFADAFQRAAEACNGCHQASAKGFIQVPSVPGKPVPDLDPLGPAPPPH